MAEEIKSLLTVLADLIGKMPDTALYILGGFFIFKMTVLLAPSWAGYRLVRLGIEKFHDMKVRPKEVVKKVQIEDFFIAMDDSYEEFLKLLEEIKNTDVPTTHSNYIHGGDVRWLRKAVQEKKDRDKQAKKERKEMRVSTRVTQ